MLGIHVHSLGCHINVSQVEADVKEVLGSTAYISKSYSDICKNVLKCTQQVRGGRRRGRRWGGCNSQLCTCNALSRTSTNTQFWLGIQQVCRHCAKCIWLHAHKHGMQNALEVLAMLGTRFSGGREGERLPLDNTLMNLQPVWIGNTDLIVCFCISWPSYVDVVIWLGDGENSQALTLELLRGKSCTAVGEAIKGTSQHGIMLLNRKGNC